MKSVILCNRTEFLNLPLFSSPTKKKFLILDDTKESILLRKVLQEHEHVEEITLSTLAQDSNTFRTDYIAAIGRLNAAHADRRWWAMPFTTKNPLSTRLCWNTFAFLLISDLVSREDGTLIVVTNSQDLVEQVMSLTCEHGVEVKNFVHASHSVVSRINKLLLLGLCLRIIRALWLKFGSIVWAKWDAHQKLPPTLMVTPVHPSSFTDKGAFYDSYFRGLSEWIRERQGAVAVAGIVDRVSITLAKRFCRGITQGPAVPLDALPTVLDLCISAWETLSFYQFLKKQTISLTVQNRSFDILLRSAIDEAFHSGNVFWNFCVYRAACRLGSNGGVRRCIFPYENRAWEKMLLLGFRDVSPGTRMVGYQHASVTPSHLNFLLVREERNIIPLPDAIVTMGAVTKDWLIDQGRYPQSLLKPGCALRQSQRNIGSFSIRRKDESIQVLFALASSLSEYVRVLLFFQHVGAFGYSVELCFRPHPTISLDRAIRCLEPGQISFPYSVSKRSLMEDLDWADVVAYASSTVGLEAIGHGIPAVYLDLGNYLGTDPMDGWTDFKWVVRTSAEWSGVLKEIQTISDQEYKRRQREGFDFVSAYLGQVTEKTQQVFLDA